MPRFIDDFGKAPAGLRLAMLLPIFYLVVGALGGVLLLDGAPAIVGRTLDATKRSTGSGPDGAVGWFFLLVVGLALGGLGLWIGAMLLACAAGALPLVVVAPFAIRGRRWALPTLVVLWAASGIAKFVFGMHALGLLDAAVAFFVWQSRPHVTP